MPTDKNTFKSIFFAFSALIVSVALVFSLINGGSVFAGPIQGGPTQGGPTQGGGTQTTPTQGGPTQGGPTQPSTPSQPSSPSGPTFGVPNASASCPNGTTATFSWSAAFKNGVEAWNYTLRINKEPFDVWAPNDGISGDIARETGKTTSYTINLPPGNYGFTIQPGFPDGTTLPGTYGNVFTCAVAAAPAPTATPTPVPPAPTATPTPAPAAPTATPTPVPQGQAGVVSCPAGFTQMVNGSNIICIQNQNQNVNTNTNNNSATGGNATVNVSGSVLGAQAPAVVKTAGFATEVKTLPKTGLPFGAWLLSGLLPVGVGMKKRFVTSNTSDSDASFVWENREFLKKIQG